jgi:hypothetical protein
MDIFNLLFDEQICALIVDETNKQAEIVFLQRGSVEHARISRWRPVTTNEFKVFLGLLFHMGTIQLPRLEDY